MGLLTKKYTAWAKYPQNYTAEQVLNQIVVDLQWLEEEQQKMQKKVVRRLKA